MPTLDWIGKEAVRNHHREVPYHLLRCEGELSSGSAGDGNLPVEGDNLLALKALLPYYAGKVKCIYIDPPYNTGNEGWVYNDNVNAPEIRRWLNKVVGAESEDLSRHDKWLCMMYPRLMLLRKLLTPDGVIFVSIDENESGHLRLLMDEVFQRSNALGTLVWKRRSSSAMRGTPLSADHEYVLLYAVDASRAILHGLAKGPESYPYVDERGRYASTDLTVGMGKAERPGQFYTLTNPRTGKQYDPNPERVWRFWPETMLEVISQDLIIWPDEQDGNMQRPRYKTYYNPDTEKPKPVSIWIESATGNKAERGASEAEWDIAILTSGMNEEGGRTLERILGRKAFAYPKPLSLLSSLVRAATRSGDIVLDSFAGSGTTGQALMKLNAEDGGNRRFILVEMEPDICKNITAERLRRSRPTPQPPPVAEGGALSSDSEGKFSLADGFGFRYCRLGEPLFDAEGRIREEVTFEELAHHIFFTETGEPLPQRVDGSSPLIGTLNGIAYYLIWKGKGESVLDTGSLRSLSGVQGVNVVYAEGCTVGASSLRRRGIMYKQVPYGVKTA